MKKTPKISLLLGFCALGLFWNTITANAQDKKDAGKKKENKESKVANAGQSADGYEGFTHLESGLYYKIVTHGSGTHKPVISDHVEIYITWHITTKSGICNGDDTVMFDSRKMNNNNPVPFPIAKSRGNGDPVEVFMLMAAGDSAVIRYPLESLKKMGQFQPFMKEGGYMEYNVKLVSVKSDAEEKKESTEKAEKQNAIDDKILHEYFTNNNIKPMKTASGLYYTISEAGKGEKIKVGQNVNVNYTGMFMDGKKFDSNTDSTFRHVQPFSLEVGKGRVIKGWDEGLQLLKNGSKARLYIPSSLAYGSQEKNGIPANSILLFDVEITDVQDPAKQNETDDNLIRTYLLKNNIQATKTKSGLYYVITQKGLGPNAKPGKKVTMNYTGKTMDGKVFDSNTDPQFKHVQPFDFTLGQGRVIKGWDEGVQLLNLGSRATFFIPSGLAYGPSSPGPGISPNSVLIFDVEVTGIDK